MKVLFATDGSREDQHARNFVASARWAAGTQIEVFGVAEVVRLAVNGNFIERNPMDFERELDEFAQSLPLPDCTVTWRTSVGKPAEQIAARSRAIDADLIVVGSRGRGPLATHILGSVSAGVIDRAPCPVLVARQDQVERIMLADDGSTGAATAAAVVDHWAIFAQALLQVVSVVDVGRPLATFGAVSKIYVAGEHLYYDALQEERERAQRTVTARAKGLKPRLGVVSTSVREGDAAEQILAAANDFTADLIVVGSRGLSGLTRLFTGSVARRVLLDARCSVLVARETAQLVPDYDRTEWLGVRTPALAGAAPVP